MTTTKDLNRRLTALEDLLAPAHDGTINVLGCNVVDQSGRRRIQLAVRNDAAEVQVTTGDMSTMIHATNAGFVHTGLFVSRLGDAAVQIEAFDNRKNAMALVTGSDGEMVDLAPASARFLMTAGPGEPSADELYSEKFEELRRRHPESDELLKELDCVVGERLAEAEDRMAELGSRTMLALIGKGTDQPSA